MNFIANETEQKLRGGYYTPADLAHFCSRWALEHGASEVLEPSCGDGAFLEALGTPQWPGALSVRAFELSPEEAGKARERGKRFCAGRGNLTVTASDFLEWAVSHMLRGAPVADAVVGNPPFIRYQYLPPLFQHRSEQIFELLRLPFTKHTNAWVPFILAGVSLMRAGGRLAMVIPSEITHVMHAAPLRQFLARQCDRIAVIDPAEIWFKDTLQGAVILLAEKAARPGAAKGMLAIVPVSGRRFASRPAEELLRDAVWHRAADIEGKWTRAVVRKQTLEILAEARARNAARQFSEYADVDVGIVTGANKFFLVTDEVVSHHGLEPWALPMFGRSEHCPGIVYDERQHLENSEQGLPTNFLFFDAAAGPPLHPRARAYIQKGEKEGLHSRYKCRIREPWYQVPSVYSTPLGMLKRSHEAPRLIFNPARALTTDTAYRITPFQEPPQKLSACFLTALTALSAELEGRYYGGGVLELVPSEIEKLLLCVPDQMRVDLDALDRQVRRNGIMETIEKQTSVVLGAAGFTQNERERLIESWHSLRMRRQRLEALDSAAVAGMEVVSQFQ